MSRRTPVLGARAAIGFMAAGACCAYAVAADRSEWLLVGALFVVAGASMAGWFGRRASRSPRQFAEEQRFLEAGLAKCLSLLSAHGFVHVGSDAGVAHGPFATATFRGGTIELGLIVRDKDSLGSPNYSAGAGTVGHKELLQALAPRRRTMLVAADYLRYKAADGGDPFEALRADLAEVVLPAIAKDEERFRLLLAAEVSRRRAAY